MLSTQRDHIWRAFVSSALTRSDDFSFDVFSGYSFDTMHRYSDSASLPLYAYDAAALLDGSNCGRCDFICASLRQTHLLEFPSVTQCRHYRS